MPDETTSSPAPTNTPVPQVPETSISTPPEAVIPSAPVEAPVEASPAPEPISAPAPEPPSGHLGGNDPIVPAPAEIIPPTPTIETTAETPVTVAELALAEILTPEETAQQTPVEPVIEATPVVQVETPAPAQIPEPVTQAPTPAQVVATVVAPIVATTIAQTFTKSMRELFTKALNARQNKKRKKLDRILSLFAKQTMITNNEVEKLLHVSDSTATRYLTTLTKEGKLKQNTKKGHATSYSKI